MPDAQDSYCPSNTTWKYLSQQKEQACNIFSGGRLLLKLASFDNVHIYNKWTPWKVLNSNQECRTDYSVFTTIWKIKPSKDFASVVNQLFIHQRETQKQVEICWNSLICHQPTRKKEFKNISSSWKNTSWFGPWSPFYKFRKRRVPKSLSAETHGFSWFSSFIFQ